ncbi:origin recognition complex subunit 5-like [Tropilaelaps mercedesae]|uniref:Origin recognition complex subunit 5-like n=1 Tax=Tropilaelaps mercedesae TaxID=418985 RepID=A0A1V9XUP7_9ACAR|nr:origin recognition complex subunit 5-like [Tropilaelaps mercedesae]
MRPFGRVRGICRERQINQLQHLLALDDKFRKNMPVQAIFVFGDSGTGKSFIVKNILSAAVSSKNPDFSSRYAWLNCVELFQVRSVFSSIFDQLSVGALNSFDQISMLNSYDSPADFLRHLIPHLPSENRLYIVFDNAQRLRDLDSNLLSIFLRLQELADRIVCCVFISTVPLSHFHTSSGICTPHEVHFPHYTQDELCKVLLEYCPIGHSTKFYEHYLNLMLSVFKNANANVRELMHIASANFLHYTAPLSENSTSDENPFKLWRNIEPHLKAALNGLYLREVDISGFGFPQGIVVKKMNNKQIIELPLYSKFLLIAAYLASYNPPSTDRKFFIKNNGRERKKSFQTRRNKPNYHLLGPRPFPLNRLLAIFHAIVHVMDATVAPTTVLLSQVTTLAVEPLRSSL